MTVKIRRVQKENNDRAVVRYLWLHKEIFSRVTTRLSAMRLPNFNPYWEAEVVEVGALQPELEYTFDLSLTFLRRPSYEQMNNICNLLVSGIHDKLNQNLAEQNAYRPEKVIVVIMYAGQTACAGFRKQTDQEAYIEIDRRRTPDFPCDFGIYSD